MVDKPLTSNELIEKTYYATIHFHKVLRAEYIVKHILEEFGIYHEVRIYERYELEANKLLKELESRNVHIDLQSFKYNPKIDEPELLINILKEIGLTCKKEDAPRIAAAITYVRTNLKEVLEREEHRILKA